MKLLTFIQGLRNQKITLNTKTKLKISGTVLNVDDHMNVFLKGAKVVKDDVVIREAETIVIRGSIIRDVEFDEGFNVNLFLAKAQMKSEQ